MKLKKYIEGKIKVFKKVIVKVTNIYYLVRANKGYNWNNSQIWMQEDKFLKSQGWQPRSVIALFASISVASSGCRQKVPLVGMGI